MDLATTPAADAMALSPDSPVLIGQVVGAYGVRGWLRIRSYTDPLEGLLRYASVMLSEDDRWLPARFDQGHRHGGGLVAHLESCDDRDAADAARGRTIAVSAEQLPPLPVGRYYWNELIGLAVWSVSGESPVRLGTVERMLETGSHDVLCVAPDAGSCDERERLIPYVSDRVVRAVDLAARSLHVDWAVDF